MAKKKQEIRSDAFVFCHGMLGFGEDELVNKFMPYWGGFSGSLPKRLRKQGYEAVAPSFSSIGGAWDRACEVYAALTGTTVDYGIAHSKKYGHDRYGKTYEKAMLPNWGQPADDGGIQRIHLLGHSFGGATVRMLSHLMTYGSEEERAVTPADELSPLFAGGKGDWLKSVTAIAGPFEGTTVIDAIGILVPTLKVISFVGLANIMGNTPFRKVYDMQLVQWKRRLLLGPLPRRCQRAQRVPRVQPECVPVLHFHRCFQAEKERELPDEMDLLPAVHHHR